MASVLTPQVIFIAFWLIILVLAAFFLRMACSICRTDMPSWRRAFVSVVLVTFLAYLTFDFTCYLLMRSMGGVLIQVPPNYSYAIWFSYGPDPLKWVIVSQVGILKYLPFVFALCVAGTLQVIVLQAQVTYRWGLLVLLIQWVPTLVSIYILSLLFGAALNAIGWTPPGQAATAEAGKGQPPAGGAEAGKGQAPAAGDAAGGSLQTISQQVGEAIQQSKDYLPEVGAHFREVADSCLVELNETAAPLTKYLPEPVQNFLSTGGWWWVLGVSGLLALFWVRSIVRKFLGVRRRSPRPKGKKRGAKVTTVKLRENLALVGESYTETGPRRLVVKGLPARLRLVILSMGTKGGGGLSEEMANRVLDWIKRGVAEVASYDSPGVRVWPPFYSSDGFAIALQNNVPIPEPKGSKSHWVILAGEVRMGPSLVHVGLALYAEDENNLRFIQVKNERWLDTLAIEQTPAELVGS